MEHYIKEIFEKKESERVHKKFLRYSKGTFTGPLITIKKTSENIKIKSSFHIIDELLYLTSKYTTDKNVHIKGVIIYNKDLGPEFGSIGLKYLKVSKTRSIYKYTLDNEVDIKKFTNIFLKYKPLINFVSKNTKLTSKKNFPKPNNEISNSFCHAELPLEAEKEIINMFCFDIKKPVKNVKISHEFIIDEVIFPENTEKLTFEEVRRLAKRKGKIKRIIENNGEKKEYSFEFII